MTRPRNPHAERLVVPVEFKAVDREEGIVEGHASVFGVLDQQDDVVHRGAFKKTIKERVPKGLVKFMDSHVYDIAHTLGTVTWAEEDSRGLRFRAKLSSAPSVKDVRQKLLEGHIDRLSIGYDPVPGGVDYETKEIDGRRRTIRNLREVKLFEISAVPLAANEEARVLNVKAVVPFQDLPLADRDREWSAEAAESRVREWAGGAEDLSDMNWDRYRRAFVWYDSDEPEQVTSYKLPIADVIDGRLTAVPRAIFAAAAAMEGARGGVDVPDGDRDLIRNHLARYYAKMRDAFDDDSLVPPWDEENESGTSPGSSKSERKQEEPGTHLILLRQLEELSDEDVELIYGQIRGLWTRAELPFWVELGEAIVQSMRGRGMDPDPEDPFVQAVDEAIFEEENRNGITGAAFEAAFSRLGKQLRKELGLDAGPGAAPPTSPKRKRPNAQPSKRKSARELRAKALELEMEIHRRAAT